LHEQPPDDITAHYAPCAEPRHFRPSGTSWAPLGGVNRRGVNRAAKATDAPRRGVPAEVDSPATSVHGGGGGDTGRGGGRGTGAGGDAGGRDTAGAAGPAMGAGADRLAMVASACATDWQSGPRTSRGAPSEVVRLPVYSSPSRAMRTSMPEGSRPSGVIASRRHTSSAGQPAGAT
jgi:hypothetical protein